MEGELADFRSLLKKCVEQYSWFEIDTPRKSMHNVELFYIYCELRKAGVAALYESGTYNGRSTALLGEMARAFGGRLQSAAYPDVHPNLVDVTEKNSCVRVMAGGGQDVIDRFDTSDDFVAIIDGPKAGLSSQADAWKSLMSKLMLDAYRPVLIFNHDMRLVNNTQNYDAFRDWYASNGIASQYDEHLIPPDFVSRYALELGANDPPNHYIRRGLCNLGVMRRRNARKPS